MYNALKPVYDTLFFIIDDNFGPLTKGKNTIHREAYHKEIFKHLDKGWGFLTESNVNTAVFPYGSLDWGVVSETSYLRAPQSYQYYLTYRLIIISHEGVVRPSSQTLVKIFRDTEDEKFGIGDIVQEIGAFVFNNHKPDRFTIAEANNQVDGFLWTVIDWEMEVTDCSYQPAIDILNKNPLCRGTQLNFIFRINESRSTAW